LGNRNHGSTLIGEVAGVRQFVGRGSGEQTCVLALNNTQVLKIREEERFIANDTSADGAAELVLAELGTRDAGSIRKEIVRVQLVVAEVLIQATMEGVGAGLGDEVDNRATGAADFGRIVIGVDLDFLNGIDRRPEKNRELLTFVVVHAVDQ